MNLKIIEYSGIRVLTTQQIANVYETDTKQISYNFNHNKERYQEGKHYILLTGNELRAFREIHDLPSNLNKAYLWTEKGAFLHAKSLNTDRAWEVYDKLVDSYFRVRKTINEELSPQMQLLMQMVNTMAEKELKDKERDRQIALAKQTADKAVETTEKIKDEFIQEFDNWRNDVNSKVREIAINSGIPYQTLFSEIYLELERRAGCDLSARQRNKRTRMINNGSRKSDIEKETTKIAIVEEDKKLKQIFDDIVRRYAVKYIA